MTPSPLAARDRVLQMNRKSKPTYRESCFDIVDARFAASIVSAIMLFVCASLTGCTHHDNVVYADFVDIHSGGWPADEFCEFNTATLDSALFVSPSERYDVLLCVRHSAEYPFTSLCLPVVQSVDNATALPDTLKINMMDGRGRWRGSQSKGIYTLTDTILRDAEIPPLYSLRLFHAMPSNPLPGLLSIGLIISK